MKLPRFLHMLYAHTHSYFWLPCRICGKMYGGHEVVDGGHLMGAAFSRWTTCPNCIETAKEINQEVMQRERDEK